MKRIILICLCAIGALTASAQVWVGGTLGASHRKTKYDDDNSTARSFYFGPTVGYDFSRQWTIALGLEYSQTNNKSLGTQGSTRIHLNAMIVNPYIRYHFAECNGVRFFCQGGMSFTKSWLNQKTEIDGQITYDNGNGLNTLRVEFCPGISYLFNDCVNLVATLGSIGWKQDWANGEVSNFSQLYADIFNTFSIGFQIYL